MKQWYEVLFENFAQTYDAEEFTKGTVGECDFIEKENNYNKTIINGVKSAVDSC